LPQHLNSSIQSSRQRRDLFFSSAKVAPWRNHGRSGSPSRISRTRSASGSLALIRSGTAGILCSLWSIPAPTSRNRRALSIAAEESGLASNALLQLAEKFGSALVFGWRSGLPLR